MILREIARVILSLNLSITVTFGRFNKFFIYFLSVLKIHLQNNKKYAATTFIVMNTKFPDTNVREFWFYASSIALPISLLQYLLSKSIHFAASYAFALASFKSFPFAVTPRTRPPFVTI